MVRAYPIGENGERIGETKSFSDDSWRVLSSLKHCRWEVDMCDTKKEIVELLAIKEAISEETKDEAQPRVKRKRFNQNKNK
jgi:hypothetical protein